MSNLRALRNLGRASSSILLMLLSCSEKIRRRIDWPSSGDLARLKVAVARSAGRAPVGSRAEPKRPAVALSTGGTSPSTGGAPNNPATGGAAPVNGGTAGAPGGRRRNGR